jgi:hypothetical protein
MDSTYSAEQIVKNEHKRKQNREWKTIGVKVRLAELAVLNKQLSRLNYDTLGNLVKDLIGGKITQVTEDQQIEIMKTNLQSNGQITGLSGKPYDFYKQIDINDLHQYLIGVATSILEIAIEAILKNMLVYFLVQNLLKNYSNSNHTNDPGYYKQSKDSVIIILENTITGKLPSLSSK